MFSRYPHGYDMSLPFHGQQAGISWSFRHLCDLFLRYTPAGRLDPISFINKRWSTKNSPRAKSSRSSRWTLWKRHSNSCSSPKSSGERLFSTFTIIVFNVLRCIPGLWGALCRCHMLGLLFFEWYSLSDRVLVFAWAEVVSLFPARHRFCASRGMKTKKVSSIVRWHLSVLSTLQCVIWSLGATNGDNLSRRAPCCESYCTASLVHALCLERGLAIGYSIFFSRLFLKC